MRVVALPEVPYGATAVRPDWEDLPTAVRAAISRPSRRAGRRRDQRRRRIHPGLRRGAEDGGRAQRVRQGRTDHRSHRRLVRPGGRDHRRPARRRCPPPRPRWTLREAGWFVLCLDAVDGHVPALPWSPADLTAALTAWSTAAAALSRPSPTARPDLPRLPDLIRDELSWWSEIAAGREPMPPTAPGLGAGPAARAGRPGTRPAAPWPREPACCTATCGSTTC